MNDPIKSPPAGESRLSIDLDDIERRLRESIDSVPVTALAKPSMPSNDPLAELARLVGDGQDPFNKIFAPAPGLSVPPPAARQALPLDPPPVSLSPSYEASEAPLVSYAPAVDAGPAYGGYQQPAYGAEQDQYQQGAQSQSQWANEPQAYSDTYDFVEDQPQRRSRAKLLIGAAVVIAAGGLAAALTMRGGSSFGDAPTIMANSGPVKVQPAQPVEDASKPNISVLERGANTQRDSKVVQSEEQPVDLGTAARNASQRPARTGEAGAPVTLAPPPPPPVANSLFAEPKRVKSVAVRPDGTIIDPNAPAAPVAPSVAAVAKPAEKPASPATPAGKPSDMAALVAASMGTGEPTKAVTRVTDAKPAPVAPAMPLPPQRAGGAPMNIVATAPAAPAPTAPKAAAPAAAPIATANATAGTYAVQLVGTTSSDEAKSALERVNTKYRSELGSHRPVIVKADDGGRTVYRVRVINMSNDDATRLCTKLKSSGATCFVARS